MGVLVSSVYSIYVCAVDVQNTPRMELESLFGRLANIWGREFILITMHNEG